MKTPSCFDDFWCGGHSFGPLGVLTHGYMGSSKSLSTHSSEWHCTWLVKNNLTAFKLIAPKNDGQPLIPSTSAPGQHHIELLGHQSCRLWLLRRISMANAITGPGVITHTWEIPKLNGGLWLDKSSKLGSSNPIYPRFVAAKLQICHPPAIWLVNPSSNHHFCS